MKINPTQSMNIASLQKWISTWIIICDSFLPCILTLFTFIYLSIYLANMYTHAKHYYAGE